jgi:hypothetical protein
MVASGAVPLAAALCFILVPYLQARRMRRAEHVPLPNDACVACDSSDIEVLAPQVIRCRACGFIGGDGVAEWHRCRRVERVERMPSEQRRRGALEALRDARSNLGEAEALLKAATTASLVDIAGLSLDRGEAKQSSWGAAIRHMRTAQQLTTEASELIRTITLRDATHDLDHNALLMSLDTAWLTDGLIVDIAAHLRIKKACTQLQEMSASVEKLRAHLSKQD